MQLLPEEELIWSPVVANSTMNRERQAIGVNSYEKEFRFKPTTYLENTIQEKGQASWLDLCCGKGSALIQVANYFAEKGSQDIVTLKGVDLLNIFQTKPPTNNCLQFVTASVVDWQPGEHYDLITCSHGLHYVGDKLKVIKTALGALNENGLFIGHLDLKNILIDNKEATTSLKSLFKEYKIDYNQRSKIIKRNGQLNFHFPFHYKGANDKTGPNYTGQNAVTSFYV